jgi:predicted hydrocarbon binding protein
VSVRRSPFAEAYGPSTTPVCHLLRGVLEALAAAALTGTPAVVETACAAMGAPACRFETRR